MGLPLTYVLCALMLAIAGWLAWREIELYRGRNDSESDVFVYSGRRIAWRALGIVALIGFAVTLALWEAKPPRSPEAASTYLGVFAIEIVALIMVPLFDLFETRQTSAGGDRSAVMKELRRRREDRDR